MTTFEAIGTAVGAALLVVAKPTIDFLMKKSKIIFAQSKIESQQKVQVIIDSLRAYLRVDRVDIYEYSNGEKTLGGIPFIWGMLTFESIESYEKSIKKEMQKFPTSWFASFLSPLLDTNTKYCFWSDSGKSLTDKGEIGFDENAKLVMFRYKNHSAMMVKFTSNIGDGILSIASRDWADGKTLEDLNETDITKILSDAHQIWYHLKLRR